jgi:MraZ protein
VNWLPAGDAVFQGASQLTLDGKGRVSMPSRHRDSLAANCDGRLTVTRHPDGCLLVYPRPTWELRREQIAQLPYSARALQRLLLGNATDVDLDSAGRLLVPTELRAGAQLERDLMLLGMGAHFELWDAVRLAEHERAALAGGLPESAAQFTF